MSFLEFVIGWAFVIFMAYIIIKKMKTKAESG